MRTDWLNNIRNQRISIRTSTKLHCMGIASIDHVLTCLPPPGQSAVILTRTSQTVALTGKLRSEVVEAVAE